MSIASKSTILLLLVFASFTYAADVSIIKYKNNKNDNKIIQKPKWRSDEEVMEIFDWWSKKHCKTYNSNGLEIEKEKRFEIFKDNLKFIDEHNSGNRSYRVGLNQFADLSNEEYRSMYLGTRTDAKRRFVKSQNDVFSNRYAIRNGDDGMLPESVDWRKRGAVTPVKNQGSCGNILSLLFAHLQDYVCLPVSLSIVYNYLHAIGVQFWVEVPFVLANRSILFCSKIY